MAIITLHVTRLLRDHRLSVVDMIALTAAILSLLTLTLFLPGGIHLP